MTMTMMRLFFLFISFVYTYTNAYFYPWWNKSLYPEKLTLESSYPSSSPFTNDTHPSYLFHPIAIDEVALEKYKIYSRLLFISYCPSGISNWTCGVCTDPLSPVRNTERILEFSTSSSSIVGYMGVSHDLQTVFIAFQGVQRMFHGFRSIQSKQRIPRELNLNESIRVHSGFYSTYQEIRPLILDPLYERSLLYPNYTLSLLGHSYGSSVASLLALEIAVGDLTSVFNPRTTRLITVGSPRIGNNAFAQAINEAKFIEVVRLIHSTDVVPHLPPRVYLGYIHYKGEVWLDDESHQWLSCNDPHQIEPVESEICSNSVTLSERSINAHYKYSQLKSEDLCPSSTLPIYANYLSTESTE